LGFGLVIEFTGHLEIVATGKYSAVANSHALQFTTARVLSVWCVFISRCLVTASNGECSTYSSFPNYTRPQLPASNRRSSQELGPSSPLTHSLTPLSNSKLLYYWQFIANHFVLAPIHLKDIVCCYIGQGHYWSKLYLLHLMYRMNAM
jgi:hypothetical protein